MKEIRTLIVDDSLLFREMLHQELERDVNVRVVAKAADAFEAGKRIVEYSPDILIVDVIMERLNGVDFIKQLLPQYYLPVIMVSSDAGNRAAAERIDGVTFFEKPREASLRQSHLFFSMILAKMRAVINAERFDEGQVRRVEDKIIAMGASTGGAEALESVLSRLPSNMPPIVVSQHMPPKFTKTFADRLNTICKLSVKEAEDGETVIPGQVYIAPGGFHMAVRKRNGQYAVSIEGNTSGSTVCPSIDMLFASLAQAKQGDTLGVLLTGMGKDGAAGLKRLRDAGSRTIGQDAASSVIYGMPKAAFDLGAVEQQLSLTRIPDKMVDWAWS